MTGGLGGLEPAEGVLQRTGDDAEDGGEDGGGFCGDRGRGEEGREDGEDGRGVAAIFPEVVREPCYGAYERGQQEGVD